LINDGSSRPTWLIALGYGIITDVPICKKPTSHAHVLGLCRHLLGYGQKTIKRLRLAGYLKNEMKWKFI